MGGVDVRAMVRVERDVAKFFWEHFLSFAENTKKFAKSGGCAKRSICSMSRYTKKPSVPDGVAGASLCVHVGDVKSFCASAVQVT